MNTLKQWLNNQTKLGRQLPAELHSQAATFIRYLHDLPNKSLTACPECGHSRFWLDTSPDLRLPFYRCAACNKGFNCLSKTPFSGYGLMHLWAIYGQYLLVGGLHSKTEPTWSHLRILRLKPKRSLVG